MGIIFLIDESVCVNNLNMKLGARNGEGSRSTFWNRRILSPIWNSFLDYLYIPL